MKGMKWAVLSTAFILVHAGLSSTAVFSADSPTPAVTPDTQNVPITDVEVKAEKEKVQKPKQGSSEVGYKVEDIKDIGPWADKKLQDLPYSISVMPQELIENVQASSPDQLFKMNPVAQPNFSSMTNDNATVTLRGFSVSTPTIDGIKSTNSYGTSVEELDRIEILNGLSGFLYGPGNVGGSVNYVTKRPTAETFNSVTVGTYSGQNYYAHGDFGGPIDKEGKFGYRINLLGQDGDTAIEDQRYRRYFASGALDWHVTNKLLVQISASQRQIEMDGDNTTFNTATGVMHPQAPDADKLYMPSWSRNYVETTMAQANVKWDINDIFTIRSAVQYKMDDRRWIQANTTLQANNTWTDAFTNTSGWHLINQGAYLFADAKFNTWSIEHKVTAGYSGYYYESRQHNITNTAANLTGISFSNLGNVAVPSYTSVVGNPAWYTNQETIYSNWSIGDDIKITDKWSILAGVSYANIQAINRNTKDVETANYNKGALTPSASLLFKPVPWITTYFTYMEALEQGTIVGTGYTNSGTILNPLLDRQYEVGAKATVGGVLLTSALFRIDKANQYSNNATPTPTYVQDGREVHQGIEVTATGKVTNDLSIFSGFTIMSADVEKAATASLNNKTPINVAQQFAKLYTEYNLPWIKGLTLTGGVYWTGYQWADTANTDKLPDYVVGDIGARYATKLYDLPTTFRLNVTNVADTSYWQNGYNLGDPRSVSFSAQVKF